jgi:hypothetical protein
MSVSCFGGRQSDLPPHRGFRQSPLIVTIFSHLFTIRISAMYDCNIRLIKCRYMNKETYIAVRYAMCFLYGYVVVLVLF